MITLEVLQNRKEDLSNTLIMSKSDYDLSREQLKVIKKEIANIEGAIIEIDHMIESL